MREAEEIDALAARCAALETVWDEAGDDPSPGSVDSVHRIIRSLEPALEALGGAELVEDAQRARSAAGGELRELVPTLVEGIQEGLADLPREAVRILVVDDEEGERDRLASILRGPNREIRTALGVEEAEGAMSLEPPDLLVVRLELGASDGRDLLLSLLSRPSTAATPVVVLTSRDEPAVRAECFALGADEFLRVPVESDLFSTAVSSLLRRRAALTRMAQEDHLTGLPNRAAFARIFGRLASLARRSDDPLTLALLDVDFLKEVNDRLGHPAGDRLLRDLAQVVAEMLRDSDVLARWGGDEFVVLLPRTGPEGAREALDKAREAFRSTAARDPRLASQGVPLSFSAGITEVGESDTVDGVVARADHLLYQAKVAGRDHVVTEEVAGTHAADILLVEDEDPVADVFRRFLEGGGFRVRRVGDGDAAVEAVRAMPPDLVVLDIMLPGKDGFEVLREMRKDAALQDLPVLILTALGQEEAVAKGFRLGVDEYLVKPVSRDAFLSEVRRLVRP